MNPWLRHPALAGFRNLPSRMLPPPESFYRAAESGFVYPDGLMDHAERVAANPTDFHGGPIPPLVKETAGRISAPPEATSAVYEWLVEQAQLRAESIRSHIRTGRPTLTQMAFVFKPRRGTTDIQSWVKAARRQGPNFRVPTVRRFQPKDLNLPRGMIYFASGSEASPGEIHGFAGLANKNKSLGMGVDITACSPECWLALFGETSSGRRSKQGVPKKYPKAAVFVDSGAFAAFKKGKTVDWPEVMSRYKKLSASLKSRGYFVAPDVIGSQDGTRRLIEEYAKDVAKVARHGSWILLAAQKGSKSRATFWKEVRRILVRAGTPSGKIMAAIPMKEVPASMKEIEYLSRSVRDLPGIHFLGQGPAAALESANVVWRYRNGLKVTSDSVLIRGTFGRGFLAVMPGIYTYAQDIVRYALVSEAFQKSYRGAGSMERWIEQHGWGRDAVPDYTDNFQDLSEWLPVRYRKLLWDELARWGRRELWTKSDRKLLVEDPDAWLQEQDRWNDPVIESWLDDQWARFLGSWLSARVKRDAIMEAWKVKDLELVRRQVPGFEKGVEYVLRGEEAA